MSDIRIYKARGGIELDVNLSGDTVWLSQEQIAQLFGTGRPAITKHLKNIFETRELNEKSTSSILEHMPEGAKRTYKTKYYNLDAIISVGYRINSKQATEFRIWATSVLKQHLIKGYTIHEKRLAQVGTKEATQALELLQKTLAHNELVTEIGKETIALIINYSKTWRTLLAYDENRLAIPDSSQKSSITLEYRQVKDAINSLKVDLLEKGEASDLFGQERETGLKSILANYIYIYKEKGLS